jgi:hypothetical protein
MTQAVSVRKRILVLAAFALDFSKALVPLPLLGHTAE